MYNLIQMLNDRFGMLASSLVFLTFCLSCGSSDQGGMTGSASQVPTELKALYDEVLGIHDEVMPRMQDLGRFQDQLKTVLDSLRQQQPIDQDELSKANRVLGDLNRAENAMWSWMHDFAKLDSIPSDEKEQFLNTERSSALSMKELMLESLGQAEEYLASSQFHPE